MGLGIQASGTRIPGPGFRFRTYGLAFIGLTVPGI